MVIKETKKRQRGAVGAGVVVLPREMDRSGSGLEKKKTGPADGSTQKENGSKTNGHLFVEKSVGQVMSFV